MTAKPTILQGPDSAREQVNLPASIALRLCLQGIRSRLGRSAITVFGIVLGVAFLTSVVAGVLIKEAVAAQAQAQRQTERRAVLLRGQVGRLAGKSFLFAVRQPTDLDAEFMRGFIATSGAEVAVAGPATPPQGVVAISELTDPIVIGLGDYAPVLRELDPAQLAGGRLFAFTEPASATPDGAAVHVLSLQLRPDEMQRAAERLRRDRQRTGWLVAVSLLITAIGISNAMLMSVTERVREIGTLKCLGALSSLVVRLFLIESAIVGMIGASAGVIVGITLACAGYGYLFGFGAVLTNLNYGVLALAGLGCVILGVVLAIVAAIYPAHVASKMIPASALASNV